jgi:hypothetical protein
VAEEYAPLDFQLSDAELEQLPPLALRLIIRKLLEHIARQDQRIRELEAEVSQLKARLDQNSSNSTNALIQFAVPGKRTQAHSEKIRWTQGPQRAPPAAHAPDQNRNRSSWTLYLWVPDI